MIYNCLVLTHTVTATDVSSDSEIISSSSQVKLYKIKRNGKLGKTFVFHSDELNIFQYLKRSRVLGNSVMPAQVWNAKAYCKFYLCFTSDWRIGKGKVFVLWFIYICPDWLTACASQGQNFQERKCAYVDSFA